MSIAVGLALLVAAAHNAVAQVGISIGEPPVCPYGYYEAPPYTCAPDGYYGPEWFTGGISSVWGLGITGPTISMDT
jgi:hypothetical protein